MYLLVTRMSTESYSLAGSKLMRREISKNLSWKREVRL